MLIVFGREFNVLVMAGKVKKKNGVGKNGVWLSFEKPLDFAAKI
jgi:hypothetical protein